MKPRRKVSPETELDLLLLSCLILALIFGLGEFGPRLLDSLRPWTAPPPSTPTLESLASLVSARVPHTPDGPGDDYWQTPEETISRGTGDCEDRGILLLALAGERLGREDGVLELVSYAGLPPGSLHAEPVFSGRAFLPPDGADPTTRRVWARIPATDAFSLAGTRPLAIDLVRRYSVKK